MIDEAIIAPRRRLVAALAIVRRDRMRSQQRRSARRRHAVMAAEAVPRRRLEARIDVARRAWHADMGAGERKSGRIMIEFRRRRVLREHRRGGEQDRRRNQCRCDAQQRICRSQLDPHLARQSLLANSRKLAKHRSGRLLAFHSDDITHVVGPFRDRIRHKNRKQKARLFIYTVSRKPNLCQVLGSGKPGSRFEMTGLSRRQKNDAATFNFGADRARIAGMTYEHLN